MEVKFKTAEWEEELRKLTIENVGLGKPLKHLSTDYIDTYYNIFSALIINFVGLAVSLIVFVIEKLIPKQKQ